MRRIDEVSAPGGLIVPYFDRWYYALICRNWEDFWGRSSNTPSYAFIASAADGGRGAVGIGYDHLFKLMQNFDAHHCMLRPYVWWLKKHPSSFEEVLGTAANSTLERIEFHYTPKHASWLNMSELEIGIMEKQCTAQSLDNRSEVAEEVAAWQNRRNAQKRRIDWTFTRGDADRKLGRHYVT